MVCGVESVAASAGFALACWTSSRAKVTSFQRSIASCLNASLNVGGPGVHSWLCHREDFVSLAKLASTWPSTEGMAAPTSPLHATRLIVIGRVLPTIVAANTTGEQLAVAHARRVGSRARPTRAHELRRRGLQRASQKGRSPSRSLSTAYRC